MARGGARVGAGRKPGSVNKRTAEIAQHAASLGITPIEVQLATMRAIWSKATDDQGDVIDIDIAERACAVADKVAPYVHPKLASIEMSGDEEKPVTIVVKGGLPKRSDG